MATSKNLIKKSQQPGLPIAKAPAKKKPLTVSALQGRKVKPGAPVYELHIVDAGAESYWYVKSPNKNSMMFQSVDYYSSKTNAERAALRCLEAIFNAAIVVVREKAPA